MFKKDLGQHKRLGSVLSVSLVVAFVSLVSLLVISPSLADVSGDGNFTIEPLVTGYDDVIGKTNRDWKFTVHTTAELVLGDVIKFIFPSGLDTSDFDLSNATQSAVSGIALYDIVEESTSYGSDVLTDGGMENWLVSANDWGDSQWPTDEPALLLRTEDSYAGDYAYSISANSSGEIDVLGYGIDLAVSTSDTIKTTFQAKKDASGGGVCVFYVNTDSEDNMRIYNFTESVWVDWAKTIDWDIDYCYSPEGLTTSYQEFSSPLVDLSEETGVVGAMAGFASEPVADYTAYIDNVEILISDVDHATNGTFEAWTANEKELTNWFHHYWTDGVDGEAISEITINSINVQAGTSATSLGANHTVDNNDSYVGQIYTGVAGDNYRISFYAKSQDIGATTITSSLSFFNGNPATATKYYNFSTNVWDDYTPVATIPNADHRQDDSLTDTFQQLTFENTGLVVPANGIITPVISVIVDTGWGGEGYSTNSAMVVDLVSMEKVTTTTPTAGVAYNASAPTVVYGMATETIASGTDFYITIGGITNGSGPGSHGSVSNLTWQVIAGTPTSSAEPYGALSSTKFNISANDNLLVPLVTSSGPVAPVVVEGGATDSYVLFLKTQPTADVIVTMTPDAQITVSPATLTFTSVNWATPQTITVTAVDDSSVEETTHTGIISHSVASVDDDYNEISLASVTVTITDNDEAGRRDTAGSSSSSITTQPPTAPTTSAEPTVQTTIPTNTPTHVYIGNTSHTVTVGTPNINGSVLITVQSEPITTTMLVGEEKLLDTDEDGENDLFLRLDEVIGNTVKLTISAITDLEFSINQALSTTDSQDVTLYLNSQNASTMAISNSDSFDDSSFENYSATKAWRLTDGTGQKTVYVKLRTSNGGTKTISDTITLVESEIEDISEPEIVINCDLTTGSAYKLANSPAVFYITDSCTKRPFKNPNIFFTYFDSWDDVQITTEVLLNSIEDDAINFMPWGPNYDPKYGALVKIVADPKVYLLLGTEKYWITSETVFNALNYSWNWVEDIDESLFDKYTIGSEITDLEHHPNYTLIKYPTNTKVYRLEPNPTDSSKQVKRWIVDEGVFNSLNFRWDRIVTIASDEVYENGLNLY